jgi:hypothetical protein
VLHNVTIAFNKAPSSTGGNGAIGGDLNNPNNGPNGADVAGIGGGVFNDGGVVQSFNTLIAKNQSATAPDFSGGFAVARYNLLGNGDGSSLMLANPGIDANHNYIGTTASPIDPLLGPLSYNGGPTKTHALLKGSLAVDHGSNLLLDPSVKFDQRGKGFPRIFDGTVDIGAYESQYKGGDPGDLRNKSPRPSGGSSAPG